MHISEHRQSPLITLHCNMDLEMKCIVKSAVQVTVKLMVTECCRGLCFSKVENS